ncbi:MAG: DUF1622 domain-containing protein [Actinobacteria bacterium]|nr:DUF1622 domain-containing protein [Actinomycetota bacterium]
MSDWRFDEVVEAVGRTVDAAGVAVTVVGIAWALVVFAMRSRRTAADDAYRSLRRGIGRSILVGLELLVAGDIIRTVAIDATFESVGVLAAIVAVRGFLSLSLEVETTGRWPWQRGAGRPTGEKPQ